jgi:hypothetical protein
MGLEYISQLLLTEAKRDAAEQIDAVGQKPAPGFL